MPGSSDQFGDGISAFGREMAKMHNSLMQTLKECAHDRPTAKTGGPFGWSMAALKARARPKYVEGALCSFSISYGLS
jgi:hypothetical protein